MLTIAKAPPTDPALDQQELYNRGLEEVRTLARRLWTDHNVHDPGITILELACYALTDLSFRASLPMEDLLASAGDNAEEMKKQFFTARQILPGRPLTVADYRKLLIDLPGVKNAWIQPSDRKLYADTPAVKLRTTKPGGPGIREVAVRGLYRVLVELMEGVTGAAAQEVLDAVARRLQANRNLCEDFVGVTTVEQEHFIVCAELELRPDADLDRVHADVLFLIGQYLAPGVANYNLADMRARRKADGSRYTVDQIFAGPPLDCGFIDDEELARADLRSEIRLSDIISVVMDVEGVLAVRDIHINLAGTTTPPTDRWRVPVTPGKQPILDRDHCRLVLYKRNIPMIARPDQVRDRLQALAAEATGKVETIRREDLDIPLGRHRALQRYHSFQNHFPALYGLGDQGLPSGATEARKALAYQLKGYLLFFDQLLANGCAQLAHLKDLFSTDPGRERTYFYQAVDSFPDWRKIYADPDGAKTIMENLDDPEDGFDRRNRFLDHLLARFAEQFHEYVAIMSSALGASARSLAPIKCDFLNSYPAISAERGLGHDHTLATAGDLWNTNNVSGLKRRLCRLLGIPGASRRDLGEVTLDARVQVQDTPPDGFRFRVLAAAGPAILLAGENAHATEDEARTQLRRTLHFAQLPLGYRRLGTASPFSFAIVDDAGVVLSRPPEPFATATGRDQAIDALIAQLRERYNEEGMFLIENLLLREGDFEEPLLPICVDPSCTDCADDDPYSYRIHVVLPAYAGRFTNMEFRRFAEEIIRQEAPAHILPKICWIDRAHMKTVEKCYRAWLEAAVAGPAADRKPKLQELVEALYAAKNVYPTEPLRDCVPGDERDKFILGRTTLGTLE